MLSISKYTNENNFSNFLNYFNKITLFPMQRNNNNLSLIIKQTKMRRYKLLWITFFVANVTFAQKGGFNPANTKNNFKFGLNTGFVGDRFALGVGWEFKVANKQSLQIELMPIFLRDRYESRNGFGVALSYRKYVSKNKEGLQGIYFSPALKISSLKETGYYTYSVPLKTNYFNASILFGKQWVYKSGFSLDINGGLGFYRGNENYKNYRNSYLASDIIYGISPNLNIKIGYAF